MYGSTILLPFASILQRFLLREQKRSKHLLPADCQLARRTALAVGQALGQRSKRSHVGITVNVGTEGTDLTTQAAGNLNTLRQELGLRNGAGWRFRS